MKNSGAIKLAAVLAVIALSAAPAVGLDGEVLINRRAANAGGITPNDDPGFPVRISRTGKYKLTGNLNIPAGQNGIVVVANNVTLDLNGFRITGADQAIIGINAPNADGLTVMNGAISQFTSHGITTRGFAIIQDMQITNNGGIGVILDNTGRVLRSTISENANGILCFSRCLVAQNVITRSTLDTGVNLQTTAGGHLVLGNVIANNKKFGIYAEGVTGFADNTLTGNATSVLGPVFEVHPNYCQPDCPP